MHGHCGEIGLENAGLALADTLGSKAVLVWALGLLAAGQSAMEHELEDLRRQVAALRLRSGESLVGVLPIQPIIDVVHDIVGVSVIVASQIADVYFHVVYTILTELAKLIFNMLQVLIDDLAEAERSMQPLARA